MNGANGEGRGPVAWMARNPVTSNLLMFVALVGGLMGLFGTKQEIFPEFDLDFINVQVEYPGATPADVEQGVTLAIEEAVRGLDGVKRVTSVSVEGFGVVTIELLLGVNNDRVLSDVKSAIDELRTLPQDAEEPKVALMTRRRPVIDLIVAGDMEFGALHEIAEKVREDLLADPGITQIEMYGVPPLEIAIEIPRATLESLELTPEQVAAQVRGASVELPGGDVATRGGDILVRVSDRRLSGADFADIVLKGTPAGGSVRLGDVARITDGYADTDQATYYHGMRAVGLIVQRVGEETPMGVSRAVRDVAARLTEELPDTVTIAIWDDDSEILRDRIDLLQRNAKIGLVLVLIVLALFLEVHLAFWVAMGIPVSFMGAFLFFPWLGISINMISLFALIVTLGMVVDDAIVVGENVFSKIEQGVPRTRAAIEGALEMTLPVTFAVFTTIAAFSPLLFVPGVMGKIFGSFPIIIGLIFLVSLVESFFILPAHLAHGRGREPTGLLGWIERERRFVGHGLDRFIEKIYRPIVEWVLRFRYVTMAIAIASLAMGFGLVASGILPFNFFPDIEGDQVAVGVRLPFGAPIEDTMRAQRALEKAANETIDKFGGEQYTRGLLTMLGEGMRAGGSSGASQEIGSHVVTMELALVPQDERAFTSGEFAAAWREATPPLPGVESLVFSAAVGPSAGHAVDVQLAHSNTAVLAEAARRVEEMLRGYPELMSIENTYAAGKPQLDYRLKPSARNLGLTAGELARQIRGSFFGAEALREQRGRNEMRVMVRLPESDRGSEFDIEQYRVRTPDGAFVPLGYVADVTRARSATSIVREDGRRIVNVRAKLKPGVPSPRPVIESLQANDIPKLTRDTPGLAVEFAGQQRSQQETFSQLGRNFVFAQFLIFALLAVPLGSYVLPLIIMSAIPFSIVGALLGHLGMGYSLSLISIFGIIALTGVVVNDSLVLVTTAVRMRADGLDAHDAIVGAGVRRFRPILLTSLTTFFGLAPMIFETSVQARFLIPMALSLGFGIVLSTPVALTLVPANYMIWEDIKRFVARRRARGAGKTADQAPAADDGATRT
ncbi:efflux RND transporter permease subunit [bacterium]|nr:efflux RND transporter permease subunit [bacterium]